MPKKFGWHPIFIKNKNFESPNWFHLCYIRVLADLSLCQPYGRNQVFSQSNLTLLILKLYSMIRSLPCPIQDDQNYIKTTSFENESYGKSAHQKSEVGLLICLVWLVLIVYKMISWPCRCHIWPAKSLTTLHKYVGWSEPLYTAHSIHSHF